MGRAPPIIKIEVKKLILPCLSIPWQPLPQTNSELLYKNKIPRVKIKKVVAMNFYCFLMLLIFSVFTSYMIKSTILRRNHPPFPPLYSMSVLNLFEWYTNTDKVKLAKYVAVSYTLKTLTTMNAKKETYYSLKYNLVMNTYNVSLIISPVSWGYWFPRNV